MLSLVRLRTPVLTPEHGGNRDERHGEETEAGPNGSHEYQVRSAFRHA
jgi:hypothetical protein